MSVSPADLEELEEVEGWVMMMAELEVGAAASWMLALCLQEGVSRPRCVARNAQRRNVQAGCCCSVFCFPQPTAHS
jgi:hypothetical protein